jgi:formylglycine-generating enzyme required for sulfatase activity
MLQSLSVSDRRELFRLLRSLPSAQFAELVTSIFPPAGVVPPFPASQAERVGALLEWLGGPTGEDYFDEFIKVLNEIAPGKFQPSQPAPTIEPPTPTAEPVPQPPPVQTATPSTPAPQAAPSSDFQVDLGGGVTLEMVYIPAGSFFMGEPDRDDCHKVDVPAFYMGKYAVTQRQWWVVSRFNQMETKLKLLPSQFRGDARPVENVNWYEAIEFCNRLSTYSGREFRLPSEAEWEYACRANTETAYHFGDNISENLANYGSDVQKGFMLVVDLYASFLTSLISPASKGKGSASVGLYPANAFGLHDMHGNVSEWCQDVWHGNYEGAPTDGSAWATGGNQQRRIIRGGSWLTAPRYCRSAFRYNYNADYRCSTVGFRVCCSAPRLSQ